MANADRLLSLVDNYRFTEDECAAILSLYKLLDTRLFVKIIDVVLSNDSSSKLIFHDFTNLLGSKYTEEVTTSIINQERLKELEKDITDLLFLHGVDNSPSFKIDNKEIAKTIESEKRKELILDVLQGTRNDGTANDKLISAIKMKFITDSNTSDMDLDNILISLNDYIVPISAEHQYLTHADRIFMADNGVDEETMKKLKALRNIGLYNEMREDEEESNG